jgi:hypothetical protein
MSAYEIVPYESVDGLHFGSSPDEVRAHFGARFRSFNRTGSQPYPSDYFPDIGVFAYYDATAQLEAVELASPAHAVLEGRDLSSSNIRELKEFLASKDRISGSKSTVLFRHCLG